MQEGIPLPYPCKPGISPLGASDGDLPGMFACGTPIPANHSPTGLKTTTAFPDQKCEVSRATFHPALHPNLFARFRVGRRIRGKCAGNRVTHCLRNRISYSLRNIYHFGLVRHATPRHRFSFDAHQDVMSPGHQPHRTHQPVHFVLQLLPPLVEPPQEPPQDPLAKNPLI